MPDYRLEGAGNVRAAAGGACAGAWPVESSRKTAGPLPGELPIRRRPVEEAIDADAEDAMLFGEPEDLALEGFTVRTRLGADGLPLGTRFGADGLPLGARLVPDSLDLDPQFVSDGLDIAAHAGDAGEDQRRQRDAHTNDGESFLAESGHVGARHDDPMGLRKAILPRPPRS